MPIPVNYDEWFERLLPHCQEGHSAPRRATFSPGTLLVSKKTGRRATVALSDEHSTTLDYGRSMRTFSTIQVAQRYNVT